MSKKLLIYNPISNAGHLDSWSSVILEELVKLGKDPIYAGEDIQIIKENINDINIIKKIKFVKFSNIQDKIFIKFKSLILRIINFFFSKLFKKNYSYNLFFNPKFFFKTSDSILKKFDINQKDILVINMFLDIYTINKKTWLECDKKYNFSWCGIHFHDVKSRIEIINSLKNNIFLIFLIKDLTNKYDIKKNHYLSEFTYIKKNEKQNILEKKIKNYSRERKIIFMGGAIGKRKNLSNWSKIIDQIDNDKYYFIQIGKVFFSDLDFEDKLAFKKILKHHPKNIFIYNRFIKREKDFNSLINMSDAIYAVYKNFKSSSNMISKSLSFKIPILVSQRGQMELDVKKYENGEIVAEDDVTNSIRLLEKITNNKNKYKFDYQKINNMFESRIKDIFSRY